MRILDVKNNKSLKKVNIYLTNLEAQELLGDLKAMLESEEKTFHAHVNDLMYEHEITLTLYDENNLMMFDNRSKKLIKSDE